MNKLRLPSLRSLINYTGAICSIVTLVASLFDERIKPVFVLAVCCTYLLILLIEFSVAVIKILKVETAKNGYSTNFVYVAYDERDDRYHKYDTYKAIQCKRPYLNSIWMKFDWTGTKTPKIDSELQTTGQKKYGCKESDILEERFDSVEMIFRSTLLYNQVTTVHLHAELDDEDKASQPFVAYKVEEPISLILFNVTLRNREENFKEKAMLYKIPNNGTAINSNPIKEISFDKVTKSYSYPLSEPKPGYTYRLCWKKNI